MAGGDLFREKIKWVIFIGLGQPRMVTAPDTTPTSNTYLDLEVQVTDALGHTTHTMPDVWGRTVQIIPPIGPDVSHTYDTLDRLLTASQSNSSQSLQAFNYTSSAVGNILSLTFTDPQYNEVHTYGYDTLSRLITAAVTGRPANYSESFGYNTTSGNLQTKGGLTLAYNDANHAQAVTGMSGKT